MINNPYPLYDQDERQSTLIREEIINELQGAFVTSSPSNIALISEIGMGTLSSVRRFIDLNKEKINLIVVQCHMRYEFQDIRNTFDFYRRFTHLITKQLPDIPLGLKTLSTSITMNTDQNMLQQWIDIKNFFTSVKEYYGKQLLIILYSLDDLPRRLTFQGTDWQLLRSLTYDLQSVYYLVISRRELRYLEKHHNLLDSLFSTCFITTYTVGLLSKNKAEELIRRPCLEAHDRPLGSAELIDNILLWSGCNPYLLQTICHHIFETTWNQQISLKKLDDKDLISSLVDRLNIYFDRLCDYLKQDNLLDGLRSAVEREQRNSNTSMLVNLGFLREENKNRYLPFSPLFNQYLIEHGILSLPQIRTSVVTSKKLPYEVTKIINRDEPDSNLSQWLEGYYQESSRREPDIVADKYVLYYIEGVINGLEEKNLSVLRVELMKIYCGEATDTGDQRKEHLLQANFRARCKRILKAYKRDE